MNKIKKSFQCDEVYPVYSESNDPHLIEFDFEFTDDEYSQYQQVEQQYSYWQNILHQAAKKTFEIYLKNKNRG